eukprot:774975-Prorocentrum_lima.AAC.1
MHYKHRNTPGEPTSFSNKKFEDTKSKEHYDQPTEFGSEPQLCSILEALNYIASQTRPDISWAVSRAMPEMNQ